MPSIGYSSIGNVIGASAETGFFGGYNATNYAGFGGGAYNSLSAYYGYGYNSYISGVAGTSPFFANFLASTGYSGGSTSLGGSGGFSSRGNFSGFPSIMDFEAAAPEALGPLVFDPSVGFSTPFYYGGSGVGFPPIYETGTATIPSNPARVGGLPVPLGMQAGVGTAPGFDIHGGTDWTFGLNFAPGTVAANIRVPEWLNRGVYELGPETWFPPGTAGIGQMDAVPGLRNPNDPGGAMLGHFRTDTLGVWGGKLPQQRKWEDNGQNLNEWDYFY